MFAMPICGNPMFSRVLGVSVEFGSGLLRVFFAKRGCLPNKYRSRPEADPNQTWTIPR